MKLKTFKVFYKNATPMLINARDEYDAATKAARDFALDIKMFLYAVLVSELKRDNWGEAS